MSTGETSTDIKYVSLENAGASFEGRRASSFAGRSVEISTQTESVSIESGSHEGGSMIGAIFILMNAVLGAGILEFPYTFSKTGLITAFLILLFLLLCAGATHIVLAKTVDKTDATNFHQLIGIVCGNKILMLVQIALILYTVGSCIAYMVTIGDQMTSVCTYITRNSTESHYCDRHLIIPAASVIAILPIIWFKSISAFSYVSFFSVASVFYLVAAVVVEFLTTDTRTDRNLWFPTDSDPIKILSIMPIISFGYQCHMTSVPLYAELHNRSVGKYSAVVGAAMFLATLAYVTVGALGLAMYGNDVVPDIILNFPDNSVVITVGRMAVSVSICMTYPVVMFIGRGALESLIIHLTRNTRAPLSPDNSVFRYSSILLWFFVTLVVATFAKGLNDVIAVVGSIAATFMFLFPGCMIVVMAKRERNYAHVFVGWCFILLGVFVFSWNIVDTLYEHLKGHPSGLGTLIYG